MLRPKSEVVHVSKTQVKIGCDQPCSSAADLSGRYYRITKLESMYMFAVHLSMHPSICPYN